MILHSQRASLLSHTKYSQPKTKPFYRTYLTSFVFHRCLCEGKWSDLGRDSRLSGSLIGSPSEINIFILHLASRSPPPHIIDWNFCINGQFEGVFPRDKIQYLFRIWPRISSLVEQIYICVVLFCPLFGRK